MTLEKINVMLGAYLHVFTSLTILPTKQKKTTNKQHFS